MDKPSVIFSVGTCPVDPGFGQVVVLARRDQRTLVYFCPACGTAWRDPPGDEVNDVNELAELAPAGVELPSMQDLRNSGMADRVDEVSYSDWEGDLDEIL